MLVVRINETDYADWTKHDYKVTIRKFYQSLEGMDDGNYPEKVRWVKTAVKNGNHKLPEDLLNEIEVKALIDACDNPRDRATVSLLYESGIRVSELANLRIKHIVFDEYGAQVVVSGKTGTYHTPEFTTRGIFHPVRSGFRRHGNEASVCVMFMNA